MATCRRVSFRVRAARALAATAVVASASVAVVSDAPPALAGPAPVMVGYIPLPTDETQAVLEMVNAAADTTLDFTVGITNAGNGAVMYYDHWEDGFEADLANPVQPTTEVWGDGDPSNGDAADHCVTCAGDALTPGDVFVIRNTITTPRDAAEVRFDGRDKVGSTRGFVITAGGFTTPLGSVLAASASAYDTSKYGTHYVAPVGEDTPTPPGSSPAFETTSLIVMASEDGTTVAVDRDADGTADVTEVIDEGEVTFVAGGVLQGATVTSTKPVQVVQGTGDVGSVYEARWFTLFPTPQLTSDYLNPVGSSADNQRTIVYLHNPGDAAISVTPQCDSCASSINVPAGETASFATPLGEAVRFDSGGPAFVAIGAAGAESGAAPGSAGDNSSVYDWGFTLVPTSLLTTQAVLGWAPGNSASPPSSAGVGSHDDDPVWVTTLAATTIHVDFDGDPSTGAIASVDCVGAHDLEIPVGALVSTRISDPNDSDMTGARIYTCDGTKIAAAWGEDPTAAPAGAPGFDAGYAVIPSTTMVVDKSSSLHDDVDGDGRYGPGDTITYEISIADAGSLAFTNVRATDVLPPGLEYVAGSTVFDDGDGTAPIPDDGSGATPFPLDESGAPLPDIQAGETVHLRYRARITDPYTGTAPSLTNTVEVTSDEASGSDVLTDPLAVADLSLTKTLVTPPAHIGANAVFRLALTNSGPHDATGVRVSDPIPTGSMFVSASPTPGSYDHSTGTWDVGTLANGASATLDVTVAATAASSTNVAEVSRSGAVDPDSTPANAVPAEDDLASASFSTAGPTIGDTVWYDVDRDGVHDPGEPGLAGVELTVRWAGPDATMGTGDDVVDTVTTGSTGTWSLADRPVGQHRVTVDPATLPHGIGAPTSDLDGVSSAHEADFAVAAGVDRSDVDFGYTGAGSLGDLVFEDIDGDGVPDAMEGVAGVAVRVTWLGPDAVVGGGDDVVQPDAVTDASGGWTVTHLPAGTFTVEVVAAGLPAGWSNTVDPDGGAPNRSTVVLAPGASDDAQDFGYRGDASIGDTVWSDTDGDGVEDAGEPGLGGVVIELWKDVDGDGTHETAAGTVVSAGTGTYSFDSLSAGAYRVVVTPPPGQAATTATTRDVTLSAGDAVDTVDFGFDPPEPPAAGSIGDLVWEDLDADGVQDHGEPGIGGVAVTLRADLDGDGAHETVVGGVSTLPDGSYTFSHLPPGDYRVVASTPSGFAPTTPRSHGVALGAGQVVVDADVGFRAGSAPLGSIGDRVWDDVDADGVDDLGEMGVAGVTVTLRSDDDGDGTYETIVGATTTAADGSYGFESLAAGRYQAVVSVPGGRFATTATLIPVALDAGAAVTNADAGLSTSAAPTGSIGDRVWSDADRDLAQGAGEPGVNGVTVTLRSDSDGNGTFDHVVAVAVTVGDGNYSFTGLPPGVYQVIVTSPAGMAPTSPATRVLGLAAGQAVTDADVGLATPAAMPFDLRLTTTLLDEPRAGARVRFRLDVDNAGPADSPADVVVTTVLPAGLSAPVGSGVGWSCTTSGQTVTCTRAAGLADGEASEIEIAATLTGPEGLTLTVPSTVSVDGTELTLANNDDDASLEVLGRAVEAPPPAPPTTAPPADPRPGTPLAFTGADVTALVLIAVGLVLVGAGSTVSSSRRPSARGR